MEANEGFSRMGVDVRYSGSTCVSLVTFGQNLFIANLGDSRAIIINEDPVNKLCGKAMPLTRDHKPDDPREARTILEAGGRIDSYRNNRGKKLGPERVWLQNESVPGLAMSRSFGDQVAHKVGVHAVPEISELRLVPSDKILVLASDGVWD